MLIVIFIYSLMNIQLREAINFKDSFQKCISRKTVSNAYTLKVVPLSTGGQRCIFWKCLAKHIVCMLTAGFLLYWYFSI